MFRNKIHISERYLNEKYIVVCIFSYKQDDVAQFKIYIF